MAKRKNNKRKAFSQRSHKPKINDANTSSDSNPLDSPNMEDFEQESEGLPEQPASLTTAPIWNNTGLPQYTLLEVPERVDFPPIPNISRPCFLIQIATDNPDVYKKMISLIRHGVYGHVAAEVIGINQGTFYGWAKRARQELSQDPPLDSFYTRFYNDVRRAVSIKRSELEMDVAISDPKKWLSNGPGRIFGNSWADAPTQSQQQQALQDQSQGDPLLALDNEPHPSHSSSGNGSDNDDSNTPKFAAIEIDEGTSKDALGILHQEGIIEVPRSYKAQVNKQNRTDDDVEEEE